VKIEVPEQKANFRIESIDSAVVEAQRAAQFCEKIIGRKIACKVGGRESRRMREFKVFEVKVKRCQKNI